MRIARLNVAKSILLDGPMRAAYDLSPERVRNSGEPYMLGPASPRSPRSLDRNADRAPHEDAVLFRAARLTHLQLLDRVNALAAAFLEAGVGVRHRHHDHR